MKTENSTVWVEQFEKVIHLDIGLDAALGILIFVSCYLLVALISYVARVLKPRGSKSRIAYKKRLWTICFINYCLTTLHAILTLVIYNYALFSTQACTAVKNLIGEYNVDWFITSNSFFCNMLQFETLFIMTKC